MRRLVPLMPRLDVGRHLNLLTAEAVAAALALALGSDIQVTTESGLLSGACGALGINLRVVSPSASSEPPDSSERRLGPRRALRRVRAVCALPCRLTPLDGRS